MAQLAWDQVGDRLYQTGVDRGVLYLSDGTAVAWNGLRSVEESSDQEVQAFYLDGVKYLQRISPGDFTGKLTAFTYPDEFDRVQGAETVAQGMLYHNQAPQSFGLTYRTQIGNDVDGTEHGYKIHLLYNVMAIPDAVAHASLSESVQPIEFGWSLTGVPPAITGHRPTVHISIDSRNTDPVVIETIEGILYGTPITNPRFPKLDEITSYFEMYGSLVVVDNGDGTWTAIDLADQYITMNSSTQFTIDNVDATYLDVSTYNVSTTTPD